MAFEAGYASVRSRPLDAFEFNRWWLSLERYKLLQTEDGRKQLKTRVATRTAIDLDALAAAGTLSGEYGTAIMQAMPPQVIPDPATTKVPWTDASAMLALLTDDDPRAIYLRAGGLLDAYGNPIP